MLWNAPFVGWQCIDYLWFSLFSDDLSSILKAGTIISLSAVHQDVDSNTWKDIVLPNVIHILTGILKGLEYIHNLNIQHRDVKGSGRHSNDSTHLNKVIAVLFLASKNTVSDQVPCKQKKIQV